MTAVTSYADRAQHYRQQAQARRAAGDLEDTARLEELAERAEQAHQLRPWSAAHEALRYDDQDCCRECHEHLSDPHGPGCVYADLSYATD
ncbi:hypothetical protein [Williamsia sp. D3]|uniref:hypothetical protein n=1 Tax=Williamsia sp. D3 TaxID=1313067 RepID=UPI000402C370|nr:hypothetical protein [Williamsia sp. D3]PZU02705.1 MAG: hypothetical protein DI630_07480 [Gordonia sp. (in: high G+C Gram-positive bacteria)]